MIDVDSNVALIVEKNALIAARIDLWFERIVLDWLAELSCDPDASATSPTLHPRRAIRSGYWKPCKE